MKSARTWEKVAFVLGIVLLVIGALDPLEGSVVIVIGSFMLALTSNLLNDRYKKLFFYTFLMILTGVFFLFFFSSFGGFGEGHLSYWWGLLILSYPIGWLSSIIILIIRAFRKNNREINQ
jgi:hypothetical protein